MGTRETLYDRSDVDNVDIARIIEVAAELQDADDKAQRLAAAVPTDAEAREVARELDIDPRYVEQAIGKIREDRDALAVAERSNRETAKQRLWTIGGSAAVLAMLLASVVLSGASTAKRHEANVSMAESALVIVLDRQAGLAPQLAALAGSQVDLSSELQAVRDAGSVDEKLAAVESLNTAMASALGQLPPGESGAAHQELAFELSGGWNRITTERRRLNDAQQQQSLAASRPDVWLAGLLGL